MNIKKIASTIERHYAKHGVDIKVSLFEVIGNGERAIYDVKLKKGTRESLVFARAKDIRTALQLPLFQPFYDNLSIRIAVSENPVRENSLMKILESPEFRRNKMRVCVPLGYDMRGNMRFYDLASDSAPHTLDGGGSGGGKSVFLRCAVTAIVSKYPVSRANLVIIDCGGNSLDAFHSLPHLSHPIVKDTRTAYKVLSALVIEMERRISLPPEELRSLPVAVVIWDEYNSTIKNITDVEERQALTNVIEDLLRRSRKTKINIILATQECNKGDMMISLNNLNARIAFRCSDFYNSRAIIGMGGAENLPGKGALLFKSPEQLKPLSVQGAFISPADLEKQLTRITSVSHDLSKKFIISQTDSDELPELPSMDFAPKNIVVNTRKELSEIIMFVLSHKSISKSQIKERFNMGNRVNELTDELLRLGIVTAQFAKKPRVVVPQSVEEISEGAMAILSANDISHDEIQAVINSRELTVSNMS